MKNRFFLKRLISGYKTEKYEVLIIFREIEINKHVINE